MVVIQSLQGPPLVEVGVGDHWAVLGKALEGESEKCHPRWSRVLNNNTLTFVSTTGTRA